MSGPAAKLVVSIDTEEDNWVATRDDVRIENIRALPGLQSFLTGLGLRPTYFVDFPVASQDWSAAILREIHESGEAEIGAHLHPWNTPPLDEPLTRENTMMKNLPKALQAQKLAELQAALTAATGRTPTSFRAGRFGLGQESVGALIEAGFAVDSSVTPFVDWTEHGEGGDFSEAPATCYRLDGRGPVTRPVEGGPLREVPLSCGFTRRPFAWRRRAHRLMTGPALRPLRLAGIAWRLGLVRRVIGSPETDDVGDLLDLARCLIEEGVGMIQLFFHSPSLVPGLSPFVRDAADLDRFHASLDRFVEGLSRIATIEPATIDEAGRALCP